MRCREGESREDGRGRRRRRARSARSGKGGARAVAVAVQWHSNSGTRGRRCRRGEDLLLLPSPGARRARSPFLSAARRCVPPAAVVKERSTVGLRLGCGIGLRIWERARSRSKKRAEVTSLSANSGLAHCHYSCSILSGPSSSARPPSVGSGKGLLFGEEQLRQHTKKVREIAAAE